MTDFPNLLPVAPIAETGKNCRDKLNRHLQLSGAEKLVLVSMGGIQSRLPVENWPRIEGVRYLVQQSWCATHPDAIVIESLPFNFSDLLASSDVLLCKPGYGSFVEAACAGVPVIYVGRPDWPESPALIEWLQQYSISCEISQQTLLNGNLKDPLRQIHSTHRPETVIATGAQQAADWIASILGTQRGYQRSQTGD